jgi:para-nitrobenzyl esterase
LPAFAEEPHPMKKAPVKKQGIPINSAQASSMDRRSFFKGAATLGAGIVTSALLPKISRAQAVPNAGAPSIGGKSDVICSDASTVVETPPGKILGFQRKGIYTFKGVPYGASTSGANRFMAPAAPEAWSGIRNALAFGRACFQARGSSTAFNFDGKNLAPSDEDAFLLHRGMGILVPGEDCLRLNVWTPEINGSGRRPVMVYMHGGGYEGGFDNDLRSYDGENLARNYDMVVVTHNHRLNVFGFLNLIDMGDKYANSANAGMLDCVAVLKWVRENITNFGGDPGNVTIFGQSGGGGKVNNLMAMPSAKGLFHRAICQSGPILKALEPEYSAKVGSAVMQELGLSKSQVDELQKVPVDRLACAADEVMKTLNPRRPFGFHHEFVMAGWGPTVDGNVLPHHPFDPVAPAISAEVPLMTGTILNEFPSGLDHREETFMTDEELHQKVRTELGDKGDAIIAAYRKEYPDATPFSIYATMGAAPFRRLAVEQATRKAALGAAPAYSYIYGWRTPMLDDRPGTFHACEISFVFDNAELCDHYSGLLPEALALAKQISGAWAAFARTGNPNHAALPDWPTYTADKRATMYFDVPCSVKNGPEAEGLRLIAEA